MRINFVLSLAFLFGILLFSHIARSTTVDINLDYTVGAPDAPTFSVHIVTYPSGAVPDQTIALESKVTNSGLGNATGAWLNWTLPSGWAVTSGNRNAYIGLLQPSNTSWSNISVIVGNSTGRFWINSTANSTEGFGSSDSKSIDVASNVTIINNTNQTIPNRTVIVVVQNASISLSLSPSTIDAYRAKSAQTTLRIKNTGTLNLTNVNIDITGLNEQWYSIEPSNYNKIIPNDTRAVIITFNASAVGTYSFKVQVSSDEKTGSLDAVLNVRELTSSQNKTINEQPQQKANAEAALSIIRPLLIASGIISPLAISIYMMFALAADRCPVCGSKTQMYYKGRYVAGYKCPKCRHFDVKQIKK